MVSLSKHLQQPAKGDDTRKTSITCLDFWLEEDSDICSMISQDDASEMCFGVEFYQKNGFMQDDSLHSMSEGDFCTMKTFNRQHAV